MSSSAADIFAEPMIDTDHFLHVYNEQLVELQKNGMLPRLDAKLKYKVYSIRGRGFGAHKSIVLTTDDEHFVTVELGFIEIHGKKHIYPVTKSLRDEYARDKMEFLGEIEATGHDLICKAVEVMKQFGSYFKFYNNCQNFCNMYLEAIGLKGAQTVTDGDKAAIAGIIVVILLYLFTR
ncbi:hypothetical protein OS493_021039 [Desmophyllum pertusum]|uniref:Uncharacterized protein n=1 Tax=Desmophyllum pertusum TaxID=174260 RepID=A0A9X0DAK0_9CNID|nr:hypothetical protein OS493_021039 [Desmophyllum pertusum]